MSRILKKREIRMIEGVKEKARKENERKKKVRGKRREKGRRKEREETRRKKEREEWEVIVILITVGTTETSEIISSSSLKHIKRINKPVNFYWCSVVTCVLKIKIILYLGVIIS